MKCSIFSLFLLHFLSSIGFLTFAFDRTGGSSILVTRPAPIFSNQLLFSLSMAKAKPVHSKDQRELAIFYGPVPQGERRWSTVNFSHVFWLPKFSESDRQSSVNSPDFNLSFSEIQIPRKFPALLLGNIGAIQIFLLQLQCLIFAVRFTLLAHSYLTSPIQGWSEAIWKT